MWTNVTNVVIFWLLLQLVRDKWIWRIKPRDLSREYRNGNCYWLRPLYGFLRVASWCSAGSVLCRKVPGNYGKLPFPLQAVCSFSGSSSSGSPPHTSGASPPSRYCDPAYSPSSISKATWWWRWWSRWESPCANFTWSEQWLYRISSLPWRFHCLYRLYGFLEHGGNTIQLRITNYELRINRELRGKLQIANYKYQWRSMSFVV